MNYQDFGFVILKRRREMNLSQQQLADLAGVSRNYISMIERSVAGNISVEVLLKLARTMDADPVYWFKVLIGEVND